jgi:hypothetical protein
MQRLLTCLGFAMVSGLAAAPAHAYCTEPVDYFTFGDPTPAPGSQDVVLDTILILRGRGFGIGGSPIITSWFKAASVTLTDETGNQIPGTFSRADFALDVPVISWTPGQLLAAHTRYDVTATLAEQSVSRPPEAQGAETLIFSFTTGAGLTPPLRLTGAVTAQLGETTLPIRKCPADDPCSGLCPVTGQRRALMAQVTLPVVEGGVDAEGYQGTLFLTDTSGVTFKGPGGTTDVAALVSTAESFHAQSGRAQTVSIELPAARRPYVPCFSMNVWDPAGHSVPAAALCLDPVDPDSGKSGGGCSFGRTPEHGGEAIWAAILLMGWMWRRRRA